MRKGMIFDFNGVLWWDSHIQAEAWREFSIEFRGESLSDEEMTIHVHGRNNRYAMEYLLGQVIREELLNKLVDKNESLYRGICLNIDDAFRLSPGAVGLLDQLCSENIPCTIATASGKGNLDFFVKHLNLDTWFDLTQVVYDDGKIPGKPAPDSYLKASRLIQREPGDCVVVEDSISGLESAFRAGIGTIIALGPIERHLDLGHQDGVNEVVTSLEEVQLP